jgi:hypothetical protein
MNKALYLEYAQLETERDAIEAKQATLKAQILDELKALPAGKNGVEADFGSFTIQNKTTYAYSKVIGDMEENLKNRKKQEVAMGIAKPGKVTEYVVFRPVSKS